MTHENPWATTACVVLAARHSRRWGADDKLLAPWRGYPMARHAATLMPIPAQRLRDIDTPTDAAAVKGG